MLNALFDFIYRQEQIRKIRDNFACRVERIRRGLTIDEVKEETKIKANDISNTAILEAKNNKINEYLLERQRKIDEKRNEMKINEELREIRDNVRIGMYRATIRSFDKEENQKGDELEK